MNRRSKSSRFFDFSIHYGKYQQINMPFLNEFNLYFKDEDDVRHIFFSEVKIAYLKHLQSKKSIFISFLF